MSVAEIHGVRPAELIEHQKKGRKVFGTFCVYVPDEIVIAADGIVTGLCGGSQFWVPGGEKVLPKNTCPLIKASVGARLDRTCPFFRIADMYVGETTCDGKKKAWEILGEDVPMYVMDLPQMKREKDIQKWAEEIAAFARKVEEFTGNAITPETLGAAIHTINDKRKALARMYEARKYKMLPISGKDALLVISQIAFYDDPVRCAQMTNKLCDELEQRIKDGVSACSLPAPSASCSPARLWPSPTGSSTTSSRPAAAPWCAEEMCTGTRYFENLVDETQTTLEGQIHGPGPAVHEAPTAPASLPTPAASTTSCAWPRSTRWTASSM